MRTIIHRGIAWLANKGAFHWMSDEPYLRLVYWARMGKCLHLKNPQTFNEKLQWLKLYDRNPEYTRMADKYEAKKYVAEKIGEKYIIPTLGVWDRFEDIDFDALPNQFVLKCTHDSGGLVICKDKSTLDLEAAREKINKSLSDNYFLHGREWPYKNITPRIIAEKYLSDLTGDIMDYKIHNFNGKPELVLVCSDRFSQSGLREDFFDTEWRHLNIKRLTHPNNSAPIEKPQLLEEMLKTAKILSMSTSFLRTDFYELNGKIYFGELTFFPAGGFSPFATAEDDLKIGNMLTLPKRNNH